MLPNVNQIVHISLDKVENINYKARVADIAKDTISVELPISLDSGETKLISNGTILNVWYSSNDLGQFSFATKVIGYRQDKIPLLLLEKPSDFTRIQRRDYIRVPTFLETSYKYKGTNSDTWQLVKTTDISGGGIQFSIPYSKNNIDREIEGWLIVPLKNGSIEHIKYNGKILRETNNNRETLISVQFTDIDEKMREKIIRYCFEKQVELRKG